MAGSICTWKVRVPLHLKWGEDEVDAVLTVRRASVERREEFAELQKDAAAHARRALDAARGETEPSEEVQRKIIDEAAALNARMENQITEFVVGVEGVEIESSPDAKIEPNDGSSLVAAIGSDPSWVGFIWRAVNDAQYLTPTLGEASAATPAS